MKMCIVKLPVLRPIKHHPKKTIKKNPAKKKTTPQHFSNFGTPPLKGVNLYSECISKTPPPHVPPNPPPGHNGSFHNPRILGWFEGPGGFGIVGGYPPGN